MAEQAIGERQADFDQWYSEWLGREGDKTPESLLAYFKLRLCVTLGPLPEGA